MKKRRNILDLLHKHAPPAALPIQGKFRRLRLGPVGLAVAWWRNLVPGQYRRACAVQVEWWGGKTGGDHGSKG